MMVAQLIILQLIAHLLSDFILQPQRWCDKRYLKVLSPYLFYHAAVVLITSYILSFDFGFWRAAILLTVIHSLIDGVKSSLIRKTRAVNLFFADQLLHLIAITGIVLWYDYTHGIHFLFELETRTLAIIAGFILCTKPANIIIKFLFLAFSIETPVENSDNDEEKGLPNAGKLIGITERLLALALILVGQYEAVGLIIAAKSILRFNATQKSEYVLVGTLLSFGIAVFSGIVINLINGA
ncbi:DUF3307 domain-containing protein [Tenuifilum thalassicum]|uniref:DUF3307 domain-containing protein n=1 Tax=Tenuifilum thalassicum TaxID=2590900 RepID=A0A7D3XLE7_9BACT|nr:DUF3307 domain-containing protein [Tenuifilum thalassicum]QKG80355.1 DUF3307 domain-containing protein [Tenuifilum thalassicum]